ncbi:transposable element Tcb2 transposase [Trichonephila clavipes]|nr:transposable element Tcb2 transposase [Trichonephila clavipes]
MPLRRFRRQYEQLSQFERGIIIGLMEDGWSARRSARQLGRSDCVVAPSLGAPVSSLTVRRRLAEGHLGSLCPLRVLPLTPPFGVMTRLRKLDCSGMEPAQLYVHDILQPHVLPLVQRLPGTTMLGLTRQGCHKTVTTLPWPARFPDLSPIEHIWEDLEWGVGHPTSLNELVARIEQILNEMCEDTRSYRILHSR